MIKIKRVVFLILFLIIPIFVVGCDGDESVPDIYTSIYPIEFIAKNIVGDELTVKSIYPRGKDVHDYELSPKDMIKLSKSNVIFYIGLGLESLIENAKDKALKDVKTIKLSKGLDLIEINCDNVDHDQDDETVKFYDPHIWLDLEKMQIMTENILGVIIDTFDLTEEQITKFENNALVLIEKLQTLDQEFMDVINGAEVGKKVILVDHDAYIYWQARYGLDRIRIRNDNESTDTSPKDMLNKIALAKEYNIKHICLTKNEMASAIAEQYKNELGLGAGAFVYLHHLATITSSEEKEGFDYISLMEFNLQVLKVALPEK